MIAMVSPFDLPGPQFLLFYVVLMIAAVATTLLLKHWTRGVSRDSDDDAELDPYETAYLVGGTSRVATLALARLLDRGQVSLASNELLIKPTRAGSHAVERAILARAPSMRVRHLPGVVRSLGSTLRGTLEQQGLLVDAAATRLYHAGLALIFLMVTVVGMAKVSVGVQRNRPVGFLIALVFASIVIALAMVQWRGMRTAAGKRLVRKQRDEFPKSDAYRAYSKGVPTETCDTWIALWGASALVGHSEYPQLRRSVAGYGGDGGSFISSCSGSSCGGGGGGGSCGGGGCGGCGSS